MNNLSFTSGLISTWNKFCFTGGMVLASVSLPGTNDVSGTSNVTLSVCYFTDPLLPSTRSVAGRYETKLLVFASVLT